MKRPILYNYFSRYADLLLAKYEFSKEQKSSANVGKNREHFCNLFLQKVLPHRLKIDNGEIIDSTGNRTGQLETVLLREDAPKLTMEGEAETFMIEGVFGVIEIKSVLSRTKFRQALTTLSKVKDLKSGLDRVMSHGYSLERPLRCIFAYEGATFRTLLDELHCSRSNNVPDLICVLQRGVLIGPDMLTRHKNGKSFLTITGKAAALAFLYFNLVSFATKFLAYQLNLSNYFEPINNWGK